MSENAQPQQQVIQIDVIAKIMKEFNLSEFSFNGVMMKRYPDMASMQPVLPTPQPTDEQILFDPFAGLEGNK